MTDAQAQRTLLYPRLLQRRAGELARVLAPLPLEEVESHSALSDRMTVWAPTGGGGVRVTESELRELRTGVRDVARDSGYRYQGDPGQTDSLDAESQAAFDYALAVNLHSSMNIAPHEATQPGVWAFLGCVLAPEIVRWRFPGRSGETTRERFTGSLRRNTFGRCWWRAELLRTAGDEDPYRLLRGLGEDEMVQITERTNAAGFAPLATAMGLALVEVHDVSMSVARSQLLRDVMKRLLRRLALIAFETLEAEQLVDAVLALYRESVDAMSSDWSLRWEEAHEAILRGVVRPPEPASGLVREARARDSMQGVAPTAGAGSRSEALASEMSQDDTWPKLQPVGSANSEKAGLPQAMSHADVPQAGREAWLLALWEHRIEAIADSDLRRVVQGWISQARKADGRVDHDIVKDCIRRATGLERVRENRIVEALGAALEVGIQVGRTADGGVVFDLAADGLPEGISCELIQRLASIHDDRNRNIVAAWLVRLGDEARSLDEESALAAAKRAGGFRRLRMSRVEAAITHAQVVGIRLERGGERFLQFSPAKA